MTPAHIQQIAEFLRARREQLSPAELGLPSGGRRRTPGLRREEVAMLAGVSFEWYTRLEQARVERASQEVLERIAQAMRLDDVELDYLLKLSGYAGARVGEAPEHAVVEPHVQRFLELQLPRPAYVLGPRWDILAWNDAADMLWGGIRHLQGIERNAIYQLFLGARYPQILVDYELHVRRCVGRLRAQGALWLGQPWFGQLIEVLVRDSPRFAALWRRHELEPQEDGRKIYELPEVGRLSFEYLSVELAEGRSPGQRMVIFMPIEGTQTAQRLEALLTTSGGAARDKA